jgi:hypothetical protein
MLYIICTHISCLSSITLTIKKSNRIHFFFLILQKLFKMQQRVKIRVVGTIYVIWRTIFTIYNSFFRFKHLTILFQCCYFRISENQKRVLIRNVQKTCYMYFEGCNDGTHNKMICDYIHCTTTWVNNIFL